MVVAILVKKTHNELQARNKAERQRLIQKMLVEKEAGNPTQKVKPERHILYHCNSMEEKGIHHDHNH